MYCKFGIASHFIKIPAHKILLAKTQELFYGDFYFNQFLIS